MHALRSLSCDPAAQSAEFVRAPREQADYCSQAGALALKAAIEAYWRARGHEVMVGLAATGFDPAVRAARFDVRSDLVNGLPRAVRREKAGA